MQPGTAIFTMLAVPLAIFGCTPSPGAVCAHYQTLDNAAPMLRVNNLPAHPSSKVASCTRQAKRLRSIDPHRYATLAKCIMKSKRSVDAWDCWVGTHVSPKDTKAYATYLACGKACSAEQLACNKRCANGTSAAHLDACTARCNDTNDVCATRCEFP